MSFIPAITDCAFPALEPERGEIVDEQALASALRENRRGGPALDVLSVEPPLGDHLLRGMPNLNQTPHLAFDPRELVIELQTKAAQEAAQALRGGPPRCPVNPQVLAN